MTGESTGESVNQIFSEYLDKNGHRKTPERFAILSEIYNFDGHYNIEVLHIILNKIATQLIASHPVQYEVS